MAQVRTVEFLPEIFQTPVNRQFLNATLDQLVQEPAFQKTQGYVGRRVGPGVNPQDKYVLEPTKVRNDYQLEPGVISLNPETQEIVDAITYPGITDALKLQGANVVNPDSLYASDYYTWDPFVDFDKFVNYSQYYWLPAGPDAVDVSADAIPLTDNFVVDRANGVYTFSGINGSNPVINLVRGGNYTFQVAQNNKETINFRVTNQSRLAFVIDYQNNPVLTLIRGNTYTFDMFLNDPLPLYIKTEATLGTTNQYNNGVTNNGAFAGTITFTVPQDAPDTLYYVNPTEFNMRGTINVVNGTPGTGPGFWIQTDPGVNGRLPYANNISSRDVLGVVNNGEDLGTVTFNVPPSTAQNFYYGLAPIGNIPGKPPGTVDLVTTLQFDQINNRYLDPFFESNPTGIDGTKELNGKTIVFLNTIPGEDGGWLKNSLFDPLPNAGNVVSGLGSYDSTTFDQTLPVDPTTYYNLWQIEYVTQDGQTYMTLNPVEVINNLEKFSVQYGTQYSSTSWYKNSSGYLEQMPLLTAIKEVLYYQDGTDPEIFGQIRLIEQTNSATIFIEDIVGQKNYTSPTGVVFTNGLKVVFRGDVVPASYQNTEYYVEGVGTAIQLLPVTNYITPETYTQSATVPYDSTPYDIGNYDATLNAPAVPDYLTMNRASPDLNAWARSNRWFHIDVIYASAEYNNVTPVVDNLLRARRPILEFRSGTRLFNFGTDAKQPVDVIDFAATDALSTINGITGYIIDGYPLVNGSRVIFAADSDPQVRNKIYEVEFIVPDTVPPLIAQPVINLIPATDAIVLIDQTVVCSTGNTLQGKSFWFDGVEWLSAQDKIGVNQPPLFDVYDADGVSFGNRVKYSSSTFGGSKLFSYATSNLNPDAVLGFPVRYLSLANVGDIVFDNNLYTDTFNYVQGTVGQTKKVSDGFVRQYLNRVNFVREIGWQPAATRSLVRQQFQFTYDGGPLNLDVKVNDDTTVPSIQLYVNSKFQDPANYTYTTTDTATAITLTTAFVPGDIIEVAVLSNQVSPTAFYQVPVNLENNPLNANSHLFTLGTIRNHYESIGENLLGIQGPIIGSNNSRDLGNIIPYGLQILQQSSPLTLAGYFMRNAQYNIFNAIEYNSREYIKFKSLLMETVTRNDYTNMTASNILDAAISDLTAGRTDINPFYWSDMLPTGGVYTQTVTPISPITSGTFNTVQTYNFKSANYLGLLVYLTRTYSATTTETVLLTRGTEYVVSTEGPNLTVTIPLQTGDVITIREYADTAGNFVPNTPTKMGLYPKFLPKFFYDTNYVNPTWVIQGHDGSVTVTFGGVNQGKLTDIRDQILLEFETRIYNNLKTDDNPVPLIVDEVQPGFFRTTDYTQSQVTEILSENFLTWVGWNKLDYKKQDYNPNNPFTYNYSASGNKINSEPLLGAWRGIYKFFYDTTSPNMTPWEMLGFSEQPAWWENRYGPAPYTNDNLVLWNDLANGYVSDPIQPYINPLYRRPGLQQIIPNGPENTIPGVFYSNLLNPLESVVGAYDPTSFRKSWVVGDGGPVEASWWNSSSYPFAVMRLLALTKPAEFFAVFADRDLYRFDADLDQYLYNGRYRLDANGVEVYGDGISKASYINWIVDYNKQSGRNSTKDLTVDLQNLDVRLCYRMASFTDKQYLQVYLERQSPDSTNSGLLLPDDSYALLLYKNQPFSQISYSSLIVERVQDGWSIYGYNNIQPYFSILASSSNGLTQTVSGGGTTVKVPAQYTDNIVQVPYGYVFTNATVVVDFILSLGAYLESQGIIFDDRVNGYTLNWSQMATEFLYWSQQGWANGTIINLNPCATLLKAYRPGSVVDTIISTGPESLLLDQNKQTLPTRDLIVQREGDSFSVTSESQQAISFLNLKFTSYETTMILDNISQFNDLIYDPITGARQNRMRIAAATSTEWNGVLNAQGFILNQDNIKEWAPNKKYTKGEIVLYKNNYWQALSIVQPKVEFDYQDWTKSNWTAIQKGLLPNIANKADQLANSYNINVANLESDNDLLAFGLIGYRPRQYMTDLNLNDVSQVNLYQQFLPVKGTVRAAELFTNADLGKEAGTYNIYENWAVLTATYGANANKSFFELRLNATNLKGNPSTVQVVQPQQPSQADQPILLENVWRESYKLTSTDILPTIYINSAETALPSAGYVNFNDADITVFSLDDPTSISANIDIIGVGTTIWAAKSNSYNWNIYKCAQVPGRLITITDNLNNTSIAQFSQPHELSIGDLVVVKYFNSGIDGVYRVLSVPSITSVIISYSFVNTDQTTVTGSGLVFYLQSMRVAQASDVADLPYANSLIIGVRAYVDNDGTGHWQVLEKQNPFASFDQVTADPKVPNSKFGASVTQTFDLFSMLVGSPDDNSGAGLVYCFKQDSSTGSNDYEQNSQLILNVANTVGFGSSLAYGKNVWGLAGASASYSDQGYASVLHRSPRTGSIAISQLLVKPGADAIGFGTSVTVSENERWMYVGAPNDSDDGRVYAYGRVDVETQVVTYISDGSTTDYNWNDSLVIDYTYYDQLVVAVNNNSLIYGTDYTVGPADIILTVAPPTGQQITITRRQAVTLDKQVYYNIQQDSTTGSGAGAIFDVVSVRGEYTVILTTPGSSYIVGEQLTIDGTQLGGTTPANDLVITVTEVASGVILAFTFAGSGISTNNNFPLNDYLYTAIDIDSFVVTVNGQIQRPDIDYTFDPVTTVLTFITIPGASALIDVSSDTYWKYAGYISVAGLASSAQFGISVSTTTTGQQIFIGAQRDEAVATNGNLVPNGGSVYVFDRTVVRSIIDDVGVTTYSIPGATTEPVSVSLNGQFLNPRDVLASGNLYTSFIDGQVDIDLDASTITLLNNVTLTVGDVLEIETNQFKFVQKVTADTPQDESNFGAAVEICPTSCSLYVGAPLDSVTLIQEGSAERNVNQSRLYGISTSLVANPSLTAGNTIRIDNTLVTVPAIPNNTVAGLASAINSADIPNILATATPDLTFIGDEINKIFYIGTIYSAATSYTTVVYVDNVLQTSGVDYSYNNTTNQILFVTAPATASVIKVVSGRLTIGVKNIAATIVNNRLTVLPGLSGTAFTDLEFDTFVFTQKIVSPDPADYAYFGSSLHVDSGAVNLVIGAPNGNVYQPEIFDGGETYFDDLSTTFFSPIINSGVVYTYDFLPSANGSVANPGKFVFGQQIYASNLGTNDQFGFAADFTRGRLAVGAPGNDDNSPATNFGLVSVYNNPDLVPSWKVIHQQLPTVDVNLINGVFMYDRLISSTQTYFDYIDPLQGKILGAARRNIDYIGAVDPANYNQGVVRNNDTSWGAEHVGQIWWDTNNVRFIDPNQDNITYASRRWAQVFPGSRVDIYQWVVSSVPPLSYVGPGIPLSTTSYTIRSSLTKDNIFTTFYYFWVRNIASINVTAGKTLSTTGIARYIEDPRSSGIPYIAALNSSSVAIYNGLEYISAADTILHIDYDRELTDANIHTEYQLIADGRADSFLNATLYRKLQDSFCGVDTAGAIVPDPFLSPAERYGVQFRPRQSMFADRFMALENYLGRANRVLIQYPIVEMRRFNLLNSAEPEPAAGSGAWNFRVANLEELSYQNIYAVPMGYLYLVASTSTQNGLWTIYEVSPSEIIPGNRQLNLVRVQTYDTRRYWYHVDWYRPGYNSTTPVVAEVPNFASLNLLTYIEVPIGSSVRVTANAQGKFEIYVRNNIGWDRVGLQDGTIQFSEVLWNYTAGNFGFDVEVFDAQYFDQEPVIETRKIIQAINEELFVDELAIERNSALILIFNFVFSEFTAPNWLIRTSLVDVDHKIRALQPFQTYLQDNQTFVLDYINEVKPYHVQIREFNLAYYGDDVYPGQLTDFDLPAYYDIALPIPQYVSPILLPYTQSSSVVRDTNSDTPADAQIWTLDPWREWFNNYLLTITEVNVINGGSGYTEPPQISVTGTCIEEPDLQAVINSAGQVVSINILNPGFGFSTGCIITITGGNGSGAQAVAVMGNNLVRAIKTTIKYDRCEYTSNIINWQPNVTYTTGTLVRYVNKVWEAKSTVTSATFDAVEWTLVDPATLSGADRTMGYYTPTANQPGLSLPLLIDGITYPGVQVYGVNFNENSGYDVTNYDIVPFDNTVIGPSGEITYDPSILDAIYESRYLDPYLGINPAPAYAGDPPNAPNGLVVDGGAYVDTYSSHAPEELIPGAEFDTLDMRIYTTPGTDWLGNGHGFPEKSRRYVYDPANPVLSFENVLDYPMSVMAFNVTQKLEIIPVNYNWANFEVTIGAPANAGDIIDLMLFGVGGGNQLYNNTYLGSEILNNDTILVPFPYDSIYEFVIYNGQTRLLPGIDYVYTPPQTTYNPASVGSTTLLVASTDRILPGSLVSGTGFAEMQTVLSVDSATQLTLSAPPDSTPAGTLTFYANGGRSTQITFAVEYDASDRINLSTLGYAPTGQVTRSWSLPVFQTVVSDGNLTIPLIQSMQGTNPVNLVVTVNGVRARPSEGARYIGDDSQTVFDLPTKGGYSQALIADNEVSVYVNNQALTLNVDFFVDAYVPSTDRTVTLATAPADGALVLIAVRTAAQYRVAGNMLTFISGGGLIPSVGDIIQITSWNDTSQQDILTQVFVGPTTSGAIVTEGYDDTDYDPLFDTLEVPNPNYNPLQPVSVTNPVTIFIRDPNTDILNGDPGSFDYAAGVQVQSNTFDTGRIIEDTSRLFVTINGRWLMEGDGFTVDGSVITVTGPIISASTAVAITTFTNSVVPGSMAFRIFQDMRGVQATYRITPATTTTTVANPTRPLQPQVLSTDDIIYVDNASALSQPDLLKNIWGVVMINGERIMYRERDTINNTISSLLRGTAGTAAADHAVGADVTDLGRGNLLEAQYQNYINQNVFDADGVATTYVADQLYLSSSALNPAVEVYVGGTLQTAGYTVVANSPVTVEFDTAPENGVQVLILVRRGVTWYNPGPGTASDGVPLQDTDNPCARFLQGK